MVGTNEILLKENGQWLHFALPHQLISAATLEEVLPALREIERLVNAGVVVVCAGGGGIPVFMDDEGLHGVEAVIDKDLTAALLAEELGAARLIMLTDVSCVERDWGTPVATPISTATPDELRALSFASGSMGPKVEAACRFVEHTGGDAVIGSLAELDAVSRGEAGTRISPARAALAVP